MKINEKLYPKAIVLRKWMIAVVGVVVGLIFIIFMYNMSHQNTKRKAEEAEKNQNSSHASTLASSQDMKWISEGRIERAPAPMPTTIPTQLGSPTNNAELPFLPQTQQTNVVHTVRYDESPKVMSPQQNDPDYEKRMAEKEKAMMAPITANQLVAQPMESGSGKGGVNTASTGGGYHNGMGGDDPNGQANKEAFLNKAKTDEEGVYLDKGMISPRSPYELQAGTVIPGILITGVNSDLPGQMVGQIRQNVYDSITGDHVLVPQGAKVVGLYDSKVTYGQSRVLVVWKRIIYPNGDSIDLSGMPGVDLSGYAGFHDQVNNHFGKIFGSVLLLSTMSAGAQLSQPNNDNDYDNNNPTVGQTMAQSLGTNLSDFGTKLAEKNLNIQPTLVIRPGYLFNISVTKDIVFPGPYRAG